MTELPGQLIERERQRLGISVAELASVAGVHRTTVYRLVRGRTSPRISTLRRLARVLRIPLENLTDQIELDQLADGDSSDHPGADLIARQLDLVPERLVVPAGFAALGALFDVGMGAGRNPHGQRFQDLWRQHGRTTDVNRAALEADLRQEFQRVPRLLKRLAAVEAIRAMIDVELRAGEEPSKGLFQVIGERPLQPWGGGSARRSRAQRQEETRTS